MEEIICNYDPQDLEPIIDLLTQQLELTNQQLLILSDIYHLGIWMTGALAALLVLSIIYSLIQKYIR